VYDPATAIAAIKQTPFDAVVTDKEMHGNHNAGFEVAAAARASGDMPIVMMSGGVSAATLPAVQKRLGEIGGDNHYIDKGDMNWPDKLLAVIEGQQQAPPALGR
jgi:CheY-like chemotaxis protein